MPADGEKRGSIGQVKPTGWHTVKYDCVDGKYLYNRCHLIGWQLTAENANKQNLITGTRYLNIEGMLPFENMVADYVKETGNHEMCIRDSLFVAVAGLWSASGYPREKGRFTRGWKTAGCLPSCAPARRQRVPPVCNRCSSFLFSCTML